MTGKVSQPRETMLRYPVICPKCGELLGPTNDERMLHFGTYHADAIGTAIVRNDPLQEPRKFVFVSPSYGLPEHWNVVWWGAAEVVRMRSLLYEITWRSRKPPEEGD